MKAPLTMTRDNSALAGDDETLRGILRTSRVIALVGASQKQWRDSNTIMQYLLSAGYQVHPVNPRYDEVLGQKCYPDLFSLKRPIDIVNIFRNPEELLPTIDEAIATKAKVVWMQSGVVNHEAAARAATAGIQVVMDHCIAVDHSRLFHAT
jgi:predicted CoA-binding protein